MHNRIHLKKIRVNFFEKKMLPIVLTSTLTLLFGTFCGSTPPPLLDWKRTNIVSIHALQNELLFARIVPTSPPGFIACADYDTIHYFLRRGNFIYRCVWTSCLTDDQKSSVFDEMRHWFHENTNITLIGNFTEDDDMYAWDMSYLGDFSKDEEV